ncbi:DUF6196 family protein [Micromonospora sp. WMMD736]|uniref:DUF6196 family protein n=1 Tax=Micromonospora sp. WMMD736 TaxID=3404112 RepID=UPI003B962825
MGSTRQPVDRTPSADKQHHRGHDLTLERRLGTGVVVICGHNGDGGGIYDYWGCQAQVRAEVVQVLGELRAGAGRPERRWSPKHGG